MDAQELETYEYQLAQLKLGLAKDPSNTEFLTLKEELESLIDLIKQSIAPSAAAPAPTLAPSAPTASTSSGVHASKSAQSDKPKREWKTGDDCSARYAGDGKWYPARITSVAGSSDQPIYTVVFKGYDTPETVTLKDLRPPSNQFGNGPAIAGDVPTGSSEKRKAGEPSQAELDKERKKKKNEKKAETQKAKAEEQASRQKGWQSFAKKSVKKGVNIPGMSGESMFRSPADMAPQARVGVVGSGKGMTKAQERKRQTFLGGDDD
ncbi:uncharacterized protein JCM15063_000445 [Sporobolomyces koalae]|uniref:uncharacterized protein n=1 Tax=Sporobolomyces koalae TaxID=500713 RepID=UPI00316B043B